MRRKCILLICILAIYLAACGNNVEITEQDSYNSIKYGVEIETEESTTTDYVHTEEIIETSTEIQPEKKLLDRQIILQESSEVGSHTTENADYAIYPANIVETNDYDVNQYAWWETDINITFPQIYYSNEYEGYDRELETTINEQLFWQSLGYDDSFLVKRDTRDLREYRMDYVITKANENIVSVQYTGQISDIGHGHNRCYGITIDLRTGEKIDLLDIMALDRTLVERLKNKEIEYIDHAGYEEDVVIELVENFITDYNSGYINTYDNYFLEDNIVNLIVPVSGGNSNYIILRVPLE